MIRLAGDVRSICSRICVRKTESCTCRMERRRFGKVGGDLSRRIDEAVRRARKNEEWRSEYMKELLHDDDVREEERNFLLKLISKMSLGGDTDKVARLNDSEVLLAMRKKYGLE